MVVPVRNGAAGDGDEVGLLGPGEGLAVARLPLLAEHRIDPTLGEPGAHAHSGVAADVEGTAHLSQAPALAQFEQDLGTGAEPGAGMASVDEGVEARAIRLGQGDSIGSKR
jgi:hypothetical protein